MAERSAGDSPLLVAVIADTHLRGDVARLPARCLESIAAADALIHAGDVATLEALEAIESLCAEVFAVRGNVDEPALRRRLPVSRRLAFAGRCIGVIHDAGPARGRPERLEARFPEADAVVFGHSHMPLHQRLGEFQIFNPGSPTQRRRAPRRSMGLAHVSSDGVSFEHVWLEPARATS